MECLPWLAFGGFYADLNQEANEMLHQSMSLAGLTQ